MLIKNATLVTWGSPNQMLADQAGLRACLCYEVTDRDGPKR